MHRMVLRASAVSLALLLPVTAWADPKDDARRHFAAGLAAIQDGDYEIALQRFLAAQEAYPHPATLYNIAQCYMGEYIAAVGDAHNFYYAWGDNRNTVTSAAWPAGRPDPDVWFELEVAPVVNEDSGETSRQVSGTISDGSAIRPAGILATRLACSSGDSVTAFCASVTKAPGAMQLTWTFLGAHSAARASVNRTTAPLDVEYGTR